MMADALQDGRVSGLRRSGATVRNFYVGEGKLEVPTALWLASTLVIFATIPEEDDGTT